MTTLVVTTEITELPTSATTSTSVPPDEPGESSTTPTKLLTTNTYDTQPTHVDHTLDASTESNGLITTASAITDTTMVGSTPITGVEQTQTVATNTNPSSVTYTEQTVAGTSELFTTDISKQSTGTELITGEYTQGLISAASAIADTTVVHWTTSSGVETTQSVKTGTNPSFSTDIQQTVEGTSERVITDTNKQSAGTEWITEENTQGLISTASAIADTTVVGSTLSTGLMTILTVVTDTNPSSVPYTQQTVDGTSKRLLTDTTKQSTGTVFITDVSRNDVTTSREHTSVSEHSDGASSTLTRSTPTVSNETPDSTTDISTLGK